MHGLTCTLVNNMVVGVTQGYEKKLEIVGVGYRVVAKSPTQLEFSLGFSHPMIVDAPEGITFTVEKPTAFTVSASTSRSSARSLRTSASLRPTYKGSALRRRAIRRKVGKAGK